MTFLETQRTPRWIACNKSLKSKWLKCWLLSLYYLFCPGCPCIYYFVAWNLVSLWPQSWINTLAIIINSCNILLCFIFKGGPLSAKEEEYFQVGTPIAQWLGSSNSCINPILYAFFNNKYRRGFIAIIRSRKCCGRLRWKI